MKKRYLLLAASLIAIVGLMAITPEVTFAQVNDIQSGVQAVESGEPPSLGSQIKVIIGIMMFILGAIAVVMIIIGGIRYTTSNGDSASIKSAKDTILYSVVGLIVAILSYAIVNFVLDAF